MSSNSVWQRPKITKINVVYFKFCSYLLEFRVKPCEQFKQHQCQQHRPYTCFNYHFANQRRRRPVRREDGTFNYSAGVYCDKYDENTGDCPDGDRYCLFKEEEEIGCHMLTQFFSTSIFLAGWIKAYKIWCSGIKREKEFWNTFEFFCNALLNFCYL